MGIINLTNHAATPEQVEAGVVEPRDKAEVQRLLTFEYLPSWAEVEDRAAALLAIARQSGCEAAMLGGAPYLTVVLHDYLLKHCLTPLYSFSRREVVEQTQADGSVRKVAIFRHAGWVSVP